MPGSVNGIGTDYFGKTHLHTVQGTCEFCGSSTTLSSYDTVKYFMIVFVPIIPLKSLRVLGDCAVCRRHRALPLKHWNEAKDKSIVEAVSKLHANPGDPEAAKEAIGIAIGFQDEPLFQATAKAVGSSFERDSTVQSALGDGYRLFGNLEEAAACYRRAMAVEDTNESRERVATVLIKLGRSQQAAALLEHIKSPNELEKVGYLWLLVAGYQAEGLHREALTVLDRIATITPHVVESKDFKKTKSVSLKNEVSHKRIRSELVSSKEASYNERSFSSRFAPWVGPILAVVLLFAFLFNTIRQAGSRQVFVVNGLSIPYTAKINEQSIELAPGSRKTIKVPEGDVLVGLTSPVLDVAPEPVSLKTNFWTRPFFRKTFVINPDRTALIVWEKQYYASARANAPEGEQELHTGQLLHGFDSLDYEFVQFPATLKVKGNSTVKRTRVDVFPAGNMQPVELFALASSTLLENSNSVELWLKHRLQSEPDNEQWYMLLQRKVKPNQFIEIVRSQLSKRPVIINAHRAYQETIENSQPDHDLVAEYKSLLAKEPDSGDLVYLLGRVVPGTKESEELFQKAANHQPPVPYAVFALGKLRLSQGRFEEALALGEQAVAFAPGNINFEMLQAQCHMALKKYDQVIAWANSRDFGIALGLQVQTMALQAELLAGIPEDNRNAEARITNLLRQFASDDKARSVLDHLQQVKAYTVASAGEQADDAKWLQVDLESMEQAFKDQKPDSTAVLFQYILAHSQGQPDEAGEHLKKAIATLKTEDTHARRLARALESEAIVDPMEFLDLGDEPSRKRIWLAALAVRFPRDAAAYKQLAHKINFDRSEPYFWLKSWYAQ